MGTDKKTPSLTERWGSGRTGTSKGEAGRAQFTILEASVGKTASKKVSVKSESKKERKRVDYISLARYLIQNNFDVDESWIASRELPDVSEGAKEGDGIKATAAVWEKLGELLSLHPESLPQFNALKGRYASGKRGPRVNPDDLLSGNVVRYYNVLTNPKTGASFVRIPYVGEWYPAEKGKEIKVKVQWLEREIIISRAPSE